MTEFRNSSLESLQSVTLSILDPQRSVHTLRSHVIELTQLLADSATFRIEPGKDIGHGETQTSNGMAVSPTVAAMCMNDYVRTVQFVRGVQAAIMDLRKLCPDRPVRILYVGCGPYATLAVPLMAIFSPQEVSFTLLDVHAESIESAKSIVDQLGLADFVAKYETMDAGLYRIDPEHTPDIIQMEIMQACLKSEPQVAITRYLLAQAPNAVLIPEEVRIDLVLVNTSREFTFNPPPGHLSGAQRDRIPVASVFVLNRETVNSWKDIIENRLPGALARIPDPMEQRYQPMLFTVVRVYQDHVLKDYNSSLTCPKKLAREGSIKAGDTIQFHYELGAHPQLVNQVMEPV